MELLIYTDISKPRILYTLEFVFRYVLSLDIQFIYDKQFFIEATKRKLNYSNHKFSHSKCLTISPSSILIQKDIRKKEELSLLLDNIELPHITKKTDIDPFGIIFFMISRYEEYINPNTDMHDRFPATESIAYKKGLIEYPIVDAWIDWLRKKINQVYSDYSPIPPPAYHFTPSYDIDHVRAYLWKGFTRTSGGIMRDFLKGNKDLFFERLKVLSGQEKDPYNLFEYFNSIDKKYDSSAIYFWLLGDFGKFDKNPHHQQVHFRNEIRKVSSKNTIGIHPSYQSFLDAGQMKIEIDRLQDISGQNSITKNRFHFLRFNMPESYRLLLNLGITDDYSMAFPDYIGFRAGTSHPFYWYDLENECSSNLKIHPFQVMDVSLKNYMLLSKEESMERIASIIENIKRYGGHFVSLWHNSSFHGEEWNGWEVVYEYLIQIAQEDYLPNS